MPAITKSFSAVGNGDVIRVAPGEEITYSITGTFVATLKLYYSDNNGLTWVEELSTTTTTSGTFRNKTNAVVHARWVMSARTSGTAVTSLVSTPALASEIGTAGTTHGIAYTIEKQGSFFKLVFNLNAARITVTDGAASGSYGALKLFDFNEGGVAVTSCAQKYTAFAEGAALTTAAGDAAFKIGVASTAISAAANAVLAAGEQNIGDDISITLSGGTGTGNSFVTNTAGTALNGTSTAADLYLNWSGSAATIDASSTIDVTGTIVVTGILLGDF